MAWFLVVTPFHGKAQFRIEEDYSERKPDGSKRWPVPFEVVPISDELAFMPMDITIGLYLIWSARKNRKTRVPIDLAAKAEDPHLAQFKEKGLLT